MEYGMLIDLSKCMGCRGCQYACKQWNDLPAEETHNWGSYQNPPALSAKTWTLISFHEVEEDGKLDWVFLKEQCMHCLEPACISACPVAALRKTEEGAVLRDEKRCIGCRYCMVACPFGIPRFDWESPLSLVKKCNFCIDRLHAGLTPACAKTCPSGAISFGERSSLIQEAEAHIRDNPDKYGDHIYGKDEVGGTAVMYISPVPFEKLGLPSLGKEPLPDLTWRVMSAVPGAAVGITALLSGIYWVTKRRAEVQKETSNTPKEE